jgi:CBS domain-containing protein
VEDIIMFVKDVMTTAPVSCRPDDSVERVAKLMAQHDCGVIPVCAGRKLIGLITDRDITCRAVASGKPLNALPVSDVMTKTVHTVREDDDVQVAIDTMEAKQVRRLPVLDNAGNLAGIVAPSDLAPIFASMNVADFLLAVSYWSRRSVAV